MSRVSKQRQAGEDEDNGCTELAAALERAYQIWREMLCDADLNGVPWADGNSDRLFREVCRQLPPKSPQ